MSDRTLERGLRSLTAPDEGDAGLRAWELAGAEFERRERLPQPVRRRGRRALAALALATACVAAVGISTSGAGVAHWVGQRFQSKPGVRHAKRVLSSLPAPGSVLVSSRDGLWVVSRDGSRRLLGRYEDPAWSPHGLFVAAVRGHDLVAMEPNGRIHWTLARAPAPRDPSWAPDGFRIAYLSGADLRVVVGDGSDDHLFARHVVEVAPVWRPGPGHVVAFVRSGGRITVADAEFARRLWQTAPGDEPRQLVWSPDGSRLLAVAPRELRLYGDRGEVLKRLSLRSGYDVAQAASFSPDGRTIALVRGRAGLSRVSLLSVRGRAWHPRAGAGVSGQLAGVDWSPDGRWLLIAWRDADQWLFVSTADQRNVIAVSNIARAFATGSTGAAAFPQLSGWCCSRQAR